MCSGVRLQAGEKGRNAFEIMDVIELEVELMTALSDKSRRALATWML